MENTNQRTSSAEENARKSFNDFFGPPIPTGYEPRHANLPINPNETYQSTGYQSLIQQVEQPNSYIPNTYTQPQVQQPYVQQNYPGSSSHEITEEHPSLPSQPPSSVAETQFEGGEDGGESPKSKKAKQKPEPKYRAEWWRYFEQIKDKNGTVVSGRCKVKGCPVSLNYIQGSGTSLFKKYSDSHKRKGEEPQDQPDSRLVQTQLNVDGTRAQVKYDEGKMLSELTRYIAHKERPISIGCCPSFARLVIRGCGQPFYKKLYHYKIVRELKKQYFERKNEITAIFGYMNSNVSITSDIWTAGKHGLSYFCVTAHYIDENWNLQKRVLSFRKMDYPHTSHVIFKSIMDVLEEYNLKKDLSNKIFSISFDNASNNIKSIDNFKSSLRPIMNGALFHQKCACHILNLTVKA